MAKTFGKDRLKVRGDDSYLSYHLAEIPEAASATFVEDAPLKFVSGFLNECADPVVSDSVVAFAKRAGQNNAVAGAVNSEVILAFPGLTFYASFLATAGTTNAVAATDLGTAFDIEKNSVLGSAAMWHVADATNDVTCMMVSNKGDQSIPNVVNGDRWVATDNDVRALFAILNDALALNS